MSDPIQKLLESRRMRDGPSRHNRRPASVELTPAQERGLARRCIRNVVRTTLRFLLSHLPEDLRQEARTWLR